MAFNFNKVFENQEVSVKKRTLRKLCMKFFIDHFQELYEGADGDYLQNGSSCDVTLCYIIGNDKNIPDSEFQRYHLTREEFQTYGECLGVTVEASGEFDYELTSDEPGDYWTPPSYGSCELNDVDITIDAIYGDYDGNYLCDLTDSPIYEFIQPEVNQFCLDSFDDSKI